MNLAMAQSPHGVDADSSASGRWVCLLAVEVIRCGQFKVMPAGTTWQVLSRECYDGVSTKLKLTFACFGGILIEHNCWNFEFTISLFVNMSNIFITFNYILFFSSKTSKLHE